MVSNCLQTTLKALKKIIIMNQRNETKLFLEHVYELCTALWKRWLKTLNFWNIEVGQMATNSGHEWVHIHKWHEYVHAGVVGLSVWMSLNCIASRSLAMNSPMSLVCLQAFTEVTPGHQGPLLRTKHCYVTSFVWLTVSLNARGQSYWWWWVISWETITQMSISAWCEQKWYYCGVPGTAVVLCPVAYLAKKKRGGMAPRRS